MKLKQLLKNKYNGIGLVFLITVMIRIGYSFCAGHLENLTGFSEGVLTFVGQFCYAIPGIVLLIFRRKDFIQTFHIRKLTIPSVLLLVVVGVLMIPIMAFVNGISLLFTENAAASVMESMASEYTWVSMISIMALTPAVFEELIYRGVFFGGLRKAGLLISVLTSAFLFGLMHMNVNQFCYAMVMGMMMAMIVEVTGSLFSTMIIHFTVNATTTTMAYLLGKTGTKMAGAASNTASVSMIGILFAIMLYGVISIFALACIIALLYVICIAEKRTEVFQGFNPFCKKIIRKKEPNENVFSIPMIIGILICIILIGIIFVRQ